MLGILVTRHQHRDDLLGVALAARKAGHAVAVFLNDEGVRFTLDPQFLEALKAAGVELSLCDHSCEQLGITERAEGIIYGSQYNHAMMLHDSARVLVF